MKSKCPACSAYLEVDENELEEGDFVNCDECGELLTAEIKGGQIKLVTEKEKKFEELEETEDVPEYTEE